MSLRKPPTVLVVEPEPQVLRVLKEILGHAGFSVLHARSGARALRIFEQHEAVVDLMLIDCATPELEEITRRHPKLKVIGLSGPLLRKPFTPAGLLSAVESALGSSPRCA